MLALLAFVFMPGLSVPLQNMQIISVFSLSDHPNFIYVHILIWIFLTSSIFSWFFIMCDRSILHSQINFHFIASANTITFRKHFRFHFVNKVSVLPFTHKKKIDLIRMLAALLFNYGSVGISCFADWKCSRSPRAFFYRSSVETVSPNSLSKK